MKFFLISDDEDTLVGMRLAGIEGKYAEKKEELISLIEESAENADIGVILVNSSLASKAEKELIDIKKRSGTLIVEIPDKNSRGQSDAITGYIRDAIGLKI